MSIKISAPKESEGISPTLNSFLSAFTSVARSNRFEVSFDYPKGINISQYPESINSVVENTYDSSINSIGDYNKFKKEIEKSRILNFSCNSMTMPGKSIENAYDIFQNYKFPTKYNVDPVSFSFLEKENMSIRKFFIYWQSMVISNSNKNIFFFDDYKTDINLYQLSKNGKRTFGVVLKDAYPNNISSVDYSHNSDDSYIQTNVTLTYKNWNIVKIV